MKSGSPRRLISTRPISAIFAVGRVVIQPLDCQRAIHGHRRRQRLFAVSAV